MHIEDSPTSVHIEDSPTDLKVVLSFKAKPVTNLSEAQAKGCSNKSKICNCSLNRVQVKDLAAVSKKLQPVKTLSGAHLKVALYCAKGCSSSCPPAAVTNRRFVTAA